MQDLRAELAEMVDEAEWEWLAPHAQRSALLVVDGDLDLLDVGVAIASDNIPSVQDWISQQLLYKPSLAKISHWGSTPTKRFTALIVQPYVLIQDL
jgi:hypothetical protein